MSYVLEERFLRVFGVVLLEATAHCGNPARRIDSRAVRTPHLFKEHGLRALFRGFERRTHAGKARTDHDDVVGFGLRGLRAFRGFGFLGRFRRFGGRLHRARQHGARGKQRTLQEIPSLLVHDLSLLTGRISGKVALRRSVAARCAFPRQTDSATARSHPQPRVIHRLTFRSDSRVYLRAQANRRTGTAQGRVGPRGFSLNLRISIICSVRKHNHVPGIERANARISEIGIRPFCISESEPSEKHVRPEVIPDVFVAQGAVGRRAALRHLVPG